jgi:hypothetical protein
MPEEPSNAVLATLIRGLEERLKEAERDEIAWHSRMEGRFDTLTAVVANLQQAVSVDRANNDAVHRAQKDRIDGHERFHQEQDREARERERRSANLGSLITGVLVACASVASVFVSLIAR